MDETTPSADESPVVTKAPVEPIVLVVSATMMALTVILMFATRKHLRAKQISPADSPIRVE
jgi:hypothetical protein